MENGAVASISASRSSSSRQARVLSSNCLQQRLERLLAFALVAQENQRVEQAVAQRMPAGVALAKSVGAKLD